MTEEARAAEAGPVRLVATLGVAGLLSGLAIVGIYELTLPRITANKQAALEAAIFEVVPGSNRVVPLELGPDGRLVVGDDPQSATAYAAYDGERFRGYAVPAKGPGFQDTIELIFGYDAARGRITGMRVLASRETPGLGDRIIKDEHFVGQWADLDASSGRVELVKGKAEREDQVEAITGATISSRSVVKIVNGGLEATAPLLPAEPPAGGP